MKVTAIVPIKLNSERVKNKNIKPFKNGKPLCFYILETLKKVSNIDEIYVYCSNEKIQEYLPEGIKYLRRSESLDHSTTKINEVLKSFANDIDSDVYVLTHVTAPFLRVQTIEECINNVVDNQYDSAFTVEKIQTFLWENGKPLNYELNNIPRTQDLTPLYAETSGLYIFNKDIIINHNKRIGDNPFIKEISKIEAVDIDNEEDFIIADALYNYLNENE